MGIGGLSNEFNAIFRRAFASRVFPPEIVEQLGCKHVKGKTINFIYLTDKLYCLVNICIMMFGTDIKLYIRHKEKLQKKSSPDIAFRKFGQIFVLQ